MTTFEIKRRADLAGIDYKTAIRMRQVYVAHELMKWDDYIQEKSNYIPEMTLDEGIDELVRLQRAAIFINSPPQDNAITDEIIQEVRQTPIPNLIEFSHGRATCFAHDDKSPSAYWAKRVNKLACPVCGKMWDAIDILQERDNIPFHDAIRRLHAGNY